MLRSIIIFVGFVAACGGLETYPDDSQPTADELQFCVESCQLIDTHCENSGACEQQCSDAVFARCLNASDYCAEAISCGADFPQAYRDHVGSKGANNRYRDFSRQ